MSSSHQKQPIDILVKTVIVVVMVGAMLLVHHYAVVGDGFDPRGLLALGFVILATYTIGELSETIGLPHITGYLLAGLALGSSAAEFLHQALVSLGLDYVHLPPPLDEGILSGAIVEQLSLLNDLALALIAITAGGELKLDGLRKGIGNVLGILAGQALLVPVGAVLTLIAITQWLPDAVPSLASLDLTAVVALGAVIASLAFATSPAATIAVINSTGAKGPMARTVLSSVVLKDVLVIAGFSAATALAVAVLGTGEPVSLWVSLGEIAASIAMGVALGAFFHYYLRIVRAEPLLFTVATIYTSTFIMEELGGEPALMFIVVGIVMGNFSDVGETLIEEVERLSLPVYVVFFTLAGANLHLDLVVAMAVPALAMVLVRMAAIYLGTMVASRLTGAPRTVTRFAWLGFVSQAGVVIALATKARETFGGEIGEALFSLILAGVAINEVIGPVLLQFGLGFAGEVGDDSPDDGAEPAVAPRRGSVTPWRAPTGDRAALWGMPLPTDQPALDNAVEDFGRDLRAIARDLTWLPLSDLRRDSEAWLRQLRREFLRVARRASVRKGVPEELARELRNDIGELGERWRDLVLDLAARSQRVDRWSPLELVEAIDEQLAQVPERFEARIHADELAPRQESRWRRFRRWLLRWRNRIIPVRREVPLRQLVRYQFGGEVPARLEGLAALLVNAELHLADRVTALFGLAAEGFEATAQVAEDEGQEGAASRLADLRIEVDAEFRLAIEELSAISEDGSVRVERVLGTALQQLRRDVREIGTPDLPLRHRRYSRVFGRRNHGLTVLGPGLRTARAGVHSRLQQLALELELVGLEGRVRDVVRSQTDQLTRMLRGRGPTQLRRVDTTLSEWLEQAREQLLEPPAARKLAVTLRSSAEPVIHQLAEANEVVRSLETQVASEAWVNELLTALRGEVQQLTDAYAVPHHRPITGEWALPEAVPTSDLPFRQLVSGFLEIQVTRDLLDLTVKLGTHIRTMVDTLEEVERGLAFNVELAASELEVLDEDAPVGAEAGELVNATVLGAVGRSHERLAELAETVSSEVANAQQRVHDAIVGGLGKIHTAILDGQVTELRNLWLRDSARGFARQARRWAVLPATGDRVGRLVRSALGEDRLLAIRTFLGLPEVGDERDLNLALQPPVPAVDVPLVYRRLFSEHALEAGDLLAGRQRELDRVRTALASPSGFRSAAVVGLDLQAAVALVNAATRSAQPIRWSPDQPVSVAEVDAWFDDLPRNGGKTVILYDLRWLFVRRPQGFDPLLQLVNRLVRDGGRNSFVVIADQSVWDYAVRVSGLKEAMGMVLQLQRLTTDQLEQALMSRHAMSGFGVEFVADGDLGWQIQHVLMRGEDRERNRRKAWFRTLHAASAGVLQDALRLWMASIVEVDRQQTIVRIGSVPRPPLTRLAQLPEADLLTLVEVSRQGWIDAEQHAALFQSTTGWSEAHLAQLRHVGLLVPDGAGDQPVLRIAAHLRAPLHRALTRRGWA